MPVFRGPDGCGSEKGNKAPKGRFGHMHEKSGQSMTKAEVIKELRKDWGPVNDKAFELLALPETCYRKSGNYAGYKYTSYSGIANGPSALDLIGSLRLYQRLPETYYCLVLYTFNKTYALLIDPERKIIVNEIAPKPIFVSPPADWDIFFSALTRAVEYAQRIHAPDFKNVRVGPFDSAFVERIDGLARIEDWPEPGRLDIGRCPTPYYAYYLGGIMLESFLCRRSPPTVYDLKLKGMDEIVRFDHLDLVECDDETLQRAHQEAMVGLFRHKKKELNKNILEEFRKGVEEKLKIFKMNEEATIELHKELIKSKEAVDHIISLFMMSSKEIIDKIVPTGLFDA